MTAVAENVEQEVPAKLTQVEIDVTNAKKIVEPMARAGNTHDEMAIALVQNGFSYKKAGNVLKRCLEDLGVLLSRKDRFSQVEEILIKNEFAPKEWSEVQAVIEYLARELDATSEKEAMVSVLKFAKQQKIDMPTKPRGQVGRNPNSIRIKQLQWSLANATADDAAFKTWFESTGEEKGESYHLRIHTFMRQAYAAGQAA